MDVTRLVLNKRWYHQRFDGCPMFLFSIAEAEIQKEARKPEGTEAKIRVCYFEEGKGDWYLDMEDIKRGASVIMDLAQRDSDISRRLMAQWKEDEKNFEMFFWKEFPAIQLHTLSVPDLLSLWKRYYRLFIARVTSSAIIDHFALGTDRIISDSLRKEVAAQVDGEELRESDFVQIFSIATAPVRQSFVNQAEIDLLKIATGASKETVEEYQKRYFWIRNNYVNVQVLGVKHFQEEIGQWRESGKDLAAMVRQLEDTPRVNQEKKDALFRKYQFSEYLRTLLTISSDFSWWQDERKKSTYLNIHTGSELLREISARAKYSLEELRYAVGPEVESILHGDGPTRQELEERRKSSVFIITRDGYSVHVGNEVQKIQDMMLPRKEQKQIDDFRGLSASLGKAMGRVKVVTSSTEVGKVEAGDILVAVMTRPDYVVAMKKAAAIVTNEGGVTSHAAIVSRELGIPCVIGTKIATKVLRDGDIVEVNANHGVVTVLSRV